MVASSAADGHGLQVYAATGSFTTDRAPGAVASSEDGGPIYARHRGCDHVMVDAAIEGLIANLHEKG
jgi:hypothetical protein